MHFLTTSPYPILAAAAALSLLAAVPAGAQSGAPQSPVPLGANHFVVVRGDRIVVYEVDPKRGYDLRVVNSALLDEQGFIIGQFRPTGRPPAGSSGPAAPIPPVPTPRRPEPTPADPAGARIHSAGRGTGPAPRARKLAHRSRKPPAAKRIAAR